MYLVLQEIFEMSGLPIHLLHPRDELYAISKYSNYIKI